MKYHYRPIVNRTSFSSLFRICYYAINKKFTFLVQDWMKANCRFSLFSIQTNKQRSFELVNSGKGISFLWATYTSLTRRPHCNRFSSACQVKINCQHPLSWDWKPTARWNLSNDTKLYCFLSRGTTTSCIKQPVSLMRREDGCDEKNPCLLSL